ncbi:MAG: hypothetical protein V1776_01350 [Candidatus Diapherotrites archaeon]
MTWGRNLFLVIVFSLILTTGLFLMLNPTSTGGDESLNQSPVLYFVLVVLVLGIGAFLSFKKEENANPPFNFWLFVCITFSGLMIGGIMHELTHVALIQHPTQFRVHFGDSSAIFSTCCLNPGEYHYEEIAYAIQFIVMALWIFFFRGYFYSSLPPSKKKINLKTKKSNPVSSKKMSISSLDEGEQMDVEWEKAKSEILNAGKKGKKQKENDALTMEWNNLERLKAPKRG